LPISYFNIWFPAAVMACLFFAYFATLAIDHLQARHWPQSTGKIVESAVGRGDPRNLRPDGIQAVHSLYVSRGRPAAGKPAFRLPLPDRLTCPGRGHHRPIPRRLDRDRLSPTRAPRSRPSWTQGTPACRSRLLP
jgi:hypothetical protein